MKFLLSFFTILLAIYTCKGAIDGYAIAAEQSSQTELNIPNVFTPNGNGVNETWQIPLLKDFPQNRVTVYNRWGNKVFEQENYSDANAWNGEGLPDGTYYYIITVEGHHKNFTGYVTILR